MFSDPTGLKPQDPAYSAPRAFAGYGEGMLGYILSGGSPRDLLASSIYTPRGGGGSFADYAEPIENFPIWAQILWHDEEKTNFSGEYVVGIISELQQQLAEAMVMSTLDLSEFGITIDVGNGIIGDICITMGQVSFFGYFSDPGYGFQKYNWLQTVSSSGKLGRTLGIKLDNPHIDGPRQERFPYDLLHPPYIYGDRQPDFSNSLTTAMNDNPTGDTWFDAYTTLIGIGSNGVAVPLGTINWGYQIENGQLTTCASYNPCPPDYQISVIQGQNN